jgi:hypothetical protein
MKNRLASLLVAGALLVPVSAFAVPITVDFTVTGTSATASNGSSLSSYNGYAVGTAGSGWFTIDNSIGDYSSFDVGIAPIDFQFDWLGVSFNQADSKLWSVGFDSAGALAYWGFGSVVSPGCGLNCVSSVGPADFYLAGYAPPFGGGGVTAIHQTDVSGYMLGNTTWTVRTSVPEPATLALFSLGLLGMGMVRRRRA